MTALIRAELTALRTLRTTYAVAVAAVLLAAGITWADMADAGTKSLDSATRASRLARHGVRPRERSVHRVVRRVPHAGEYRRTAPSSARTRVATPRDACSPRVW